MLMTHLTYRISNKRAESVPLNYEVWHWGYTTLYCLHLPHIQHELYQSNHMRPTHHQSIICHSDSN